ncbi:helix-turn-helix domain-containing protein [Chryseobacterium sp. CBSDS_008]|uniref:helix-turn-helix domain-containing protein n=1 Tax=Chryseobacterium sp. CBSDS_008 TaxID=3415265 RepID=UPI003CF93F2A
MNSENQRIRNIIKDYRHHFKLSRENIIALSGLNRSSYTSIELGTGNVDFDKVSAISEIYGLQIWEFINPKQKIPTLEELPLATKKLVINQKDKVIYTKRNNLNLPKKIKIILNSGELPVEFTASDIWKLLPGHIKKDIKTIRVTDIISRKSFSQIVYPIRKKRGRENLFKLNCSTT